MAKNANSLFRIYLLNVEGLEGKLYERGYNCSSFLRRKKADALKMTEDKARCIGAGLLLTYAFFEMKKTPCGCNSSTEQVFGCMETADLLNVLKTNENMDLIKKMPSVEYDEYGKPYFADDENSKNENCKGVTYKSKNDNSECYKQKYPYFGISHAGNMVAVAMGKKPCGIDLERIRPYKKSVADKCFTGVWKEKLESFDYSDRQQKEEADKLFTMCWTQLEALSKLDGRGMEYILEQAKKDIFIKEKNRENNSENISENNTEKNTENKIEKNTEKKAENNLERITSIYLEEGYYLSLAAMP